LSHDFIGAFDFEAAKVQAKADKKKKKTVQHSVMLHRFLSKNV